MTDFPLHIRLHPDTPPAVDIRQTHIGRIPFDIALISRRSRYRAGTRYFTRGIDTAGHVANFNETEQILLIDASGSEEESSRMGYGGFSEVQGTTKLSFVQTRGSVPVYWAEINNLRYKPDLVIMDREDTVSPFCSSFSDTSTVIDMFCYTGPCIQGSLDRTARDIRSPDAREPR